MECTRTGRGQVQLRGDWRCLPVHGHSMGARFNSGRETWSFPSYRVGLRGSSGMAAQGQAYFGVSFIEDLHDCELPKIPYKQ